MADQVQARLDQMVPSLRDLLNQGIFTEDEIHTIVSKRRHFEYLLHRNKTRPKDYDNYITSEEQLEKLRSLRYKKINSKKKGKAKHEHRNSIGNVHIIKNIHSIYYKYTYKYANDVSIYLNHIKFANSVGSYKIVQRVITHALNLHSKNILLWIDIASQVFFGNDAKSGSIDNARVILQRGIRINSDSKDLYGQYFALELHYIQKIRGRKKLRLMMNKKADVDDEEDENEEDNYELAKIIYRNAIKAIPNDVSFHLHFITICKSFPDTYDLQCLIMNTIREEFHDIPDAWIARAAFKLDHQDIVSKDGNKRSMDDDSNTDTSSPLQILEQGMNHIPSIEMYIKVITFVKELLLTDNNIKDEDILSCLTQTFESIQQNKISSPKLSSEYATYTISTGDTSKAEEILQQSLKLYPNDTDLWLQYASLAYKLHNNASSILRRGVNTIPMYEEGHLRLLTALFQHLLSLGDTSSIEELSTLYERITLVAPTGDEVVQLSIDYLQYCITVHGSTYAQSLSVKLLTVCCTCKSSKLKRLVEACVVLEQTIALSNKENGDYEKRVGKICKLASSLDDTDLEDVRQMCDRFVL